MSSYEDLTDAGVGRETGPLTVEERVTAPDSAASMRTRLDEVGYLADEGVSTIAHLAVAMQRPLLLEGEPGTGKTALAEALAKAFRLSLIRLQCYEGIDAAQALYD
ncbi:AAA family ATPase, partial [Raoultella terrigena]|uniref:AAA family ATPase n=1 Tax=Raoultella terrigena TaxID=577 RepID=UPI003F67FBDA